MYIDDDVFLAVREAGSEPLRDARDLAYLTGQRPGNTLTMSRASIKDGALLVKQGKTRKKVRIRIKGALLEAMDRIKARMASSLSLINSSKGQPLTQYELRGAFDPVREAAASTKPELAAAIRE